MGNICCTSQTIDTANSWTADASKGGPRQRDEEERKVILPDYSSFGNGRRSEDDAKYSSNDDEEESKQFPHLDEQTRAFYFRGLKLKRARGYPELRFADVVRQLDQFFIS